jgi:hypothetical protein
MSTGCAPAAILPSTKTQSVWFSQFLQRMGKLTKIHHKSESNAGPEQ